MSIVQIYRGTQVGARTVGTYNTAGFLTNILDDILVNGFCQTSVSTITRIGSVATVTTSTAHAFSVPGCEPCLISGANEVEYNGVFYPQTIISTTQFTINVSGTPNSPATGVIICKHAPTGWSIAFTGTNTRSYRPPAGNRFYYNVDDTATTPARLRGFEIATAVGAAVTSGTNPFPTDAQASGGAYQNKGSYSARGFTGWWVLASDRTVLFGLNGASGYHVPYGSFFGDIATYKAADAYNTMLISPPQSWPDGGAPVELFGNVTASANTTLAGRWIARAYTQVPGSLAVTTGVDTWRNNAGTASNSSTSTFPSFTEGGMTLSPFFVSEAANGIRGHLPGVWAPMQPSGSFTDGQVLYGSPGTALAGKVFMFFLLWNGNPFVEISNTWTW